MALFMKNHVSHKGSKKPVTEDHMDTHMARAGHGGYGQHQNNTRTGVGTAGISALGTPRGARGPSKSIDGPPSVPGVSGGVSSRRKA